MSFSDRTRELTVNEIVTAQVATPVVRGTHRVELGPVKAIRICADGTQKYQPRGHLLWWKMPGTSFVMDGKVHTPAFETKTGRFTLSIEEQRFQV